MENKLKKFRAEYEEATSKIWAVLADESHPLYKITKWMLQTDADAFNLFPELEEDAFSTPQNFASLLDLLENYVTTVVCVSGELRIVFCSKDTFEKNKSFALTEAEAEYEDTFEINATNISLDDFGKEYDIAFTSKIHTFFEEDLISGFMPLEELLDYYSKTFKLFDRSKYEYDFERTD